MKKTLTGLLLTLISMTSFAQFYNEEEDTNGFLIGMSLGKTQKAVLANIELAVKADDIVFAYDFNRPLSNSLPMLHDLRVVYARYPLQPFIGLGYQSFRGDWNHSEDGIPLNKINLVYGARYQYRKFIVGAGMNGSYLLLTFGFIGKPFQN